MKTQYYTATNLDGLIATEDDSLKWLFPLGDLNASSYPAFIAAISDARGGQSGMKLGQALGLFPWH